MALVAVAVAAGVVLVASVTVDTLRGSAQPSMPAVTAPPVLPQSVHTPHVGTHGTGRTILLTGSKRVTAHAGTITVSTALWLDGDGSVAVRVPRQARVHGMSQIRVERLTGPQMHPFNGALALRSGTVLRLRGSYRWHGCPRRAPRVWPEPFALPSNVRVHWHRIDVPRNGPRTVCR